MTALDGLANLDRKELIIQWRMVLGGSPPRHLSLSLMQHIVAFELQARARGGLPRALRARLERIADDAKDPGRSQPGRGLKPGTRLVREWNGAVHVVDVTAAGFVWNGTTHRSLSAIARTITGTRWSGPRFFGLTDRSGS